MNENVKQLFDVDLAFCEASQTMGYKAWEKYLSKDVVFGGEPKGPYQIGVEGILPSMKKFYELKDLMFTWKPVHGFISEDETLGVTTGTYKRSYNLNGEIVSREGKYTTTWKKIDGNWRIVLDIGN